jgi:REP element-mobilizing transposase RayT
MPYNPQIHHRRSIRLKGYDYSQAGLYFITICTQNRECLFGEIRSPEMILNDAGNIANECWLVIPNHFPNVVLHEFIVMPNHIHGIVEYVYDVWQRNYKTIAESNNFIVLDKYTKYSEVNEPSAALSNRGSTRKGIYSRPNQSRL